MATYYSALYECGERHTWEITLVTEGHRLVPLSEDPAVLLCPDCAHKPKRDQQLFQVSPIRRQHADT